MKVFIDTNIFISAILFPNSNPDLAINKCLLRKYKIVVSDYIINEMNEVFKCKFPDKLDVLSFYIIFIKQNCLIVKTSSKIIEEEKLLRDPMDRPILRAAILNKCDYILTGDKDFLDLNLKTIKIINSSDFLRIK